jgi:hypothetical protein
MCSLLGDARASKGILLPIKTPASARTRDSSWNVEDAGSHRGHAHVPIASGVSGSSGEAACSGSRAGSPPPCGPRPGHMCGPRSCQTSMQAAFVYVPAKRVPSVAVAAAGGGYAGASMMGSGDRGVPLASPFALRRRSCQRPKFPDNTSAPRTIAPTSTKLPPASPPTRRVGRLFCTLARTPPPALHIQHVFGTAAPSTLRACGTQAIHAIHPRLPRLHPLHARANAVADAQGAQEEECQEGNPVLPDGLRCLGHRYETACIHCVDAVLTRP